MHQIPRGARKKRPVSTDTLGTEIKLTPSGTIGQNAIAPQEVARIIQRVDDLLNAEADATAPVWPIEHVAAHSTRIGAAHDLAAHGIDLTSIMHSGGWTDPKMPRYYTRELG